MPDPGLGPILIFASGQRCGSTLLQRYLCSHPEIIIWGEHDGVLTKMFTQFDRLQEWGEMFGHQLETFLDDGVNNFIPNMNPPREFVLQAQRQMVENLWQLPVQNLGRSIWGFKEVLYGADMALYMHRLFPNARIIHLTRNIFECFISLYHEEHVSPKMQPHVPLEQVWTRERTLEFIEYWIKVNRSFLETPGLSSEWLFSLTYEQLTQDTRNTVHQLVTWLGLDEADFDLNVFRHKIYTDRHKGPDLRPKIERADLLPEDIALLTTEEILGISELLNYDMSVPQHEIGCEL
jgi:hypothetical protein